MTWEQFYGALERSQISNVYGFFGPEEYVKHSAFEALRSKLLPEGLEAMNETVLDGATAQQIIEAAETLPMMADRRMVLVKDWPPLMPGKSKNEAAEAEQLADWLPGAPDSCTVVFYVRGAADGRKKATQALQKHASVVQFELLEPGKIAKWASGQLKPFGKRMDARALDELVFLAGRELTRLSAELEKLSAYAGERDVITIEDVRTLVSPSLESTVFQMIDQLLQGDRAGAQKLLRSMLESGENRVGVLFMLTRQLRNLVHIKLLTGKGMRLPEAEKLLGMTHFVAGRTEAQARKFSLDGLKAGYQACLDAEFDIKSGKLRDALALDHLMLALGRMEQGG